MELDNHIEVHEPDTKERIFRPWIQFRVEQLNPTPLLMTDTEIDYQINELIRKSENLRRELKKKLKLAQSKHDKLMQSV